MDHLHESPKALPRWNDALTHVDSEPRYYSSNCQKSRSDYSPLLTHHQMMATIIIYVLMLDFMMDDDVMGEVPRMPLFK